MSGQLVSAELARKRTAKRTSTKTEIKCQIYECIFPDQDLQRCELTTEESSVKFTEIKDAVAQMLVRTPVLKVNTI